MSMRMVRKQLLTVVAFAQEKKLKTGLFRGRISGPAAANRGAQASARSRFLRSFFSNLETEAQGEGSEK